MLAPAPAGSLIMRPLVCGSCGTLACKGELGYLPGALQRVGAEQFWPEDEDKNALECTSSDHDQRVTGNG
jgi:hypothetical protein